MKRRRKSINIKSLYKEYLKLNPPDPMTYHRFNIRFNDGFTFSQILKIGKMKDGDGVKELLKDKLPKPGVVIMKTDSKKRENYWREYLLKQLQDERITNTN